MDYGKLAYLKTQELQNRLNSIVRAEESIDLSYSANCNKKLCNNSIADRYAFYAVNVTDINIAYDLLLYAEEHTKAKISIMIDGMLLDSITLVIDGQQTCAFKTKAPSISAELHELSLKIEVLEGIAFNLSRVQLVVSGKGIYTSNDKLKVRYFSGNGADYVFYLSGGQIKIMSRKHGTASFAESELSPFCINDFDIVKLPKVTFGASNYTITESYAIFLTDLKGYLFFCNFDFTSGSFGKVRLVSKNVKAFSAVHSFKPFGAIVAYIKDDGCFYRHVEVCEDRNYLMSEKEIVSLTGLVDVKVLQLNQGVRVVVTDENKNASLYYDCCYEMPKNDSLLKVGLSVVLS